MKGVSWRLVGDIGGYLIQVGFVAIMARYLTLYEFGLVSAAIITNRFLNTVSSISVGNTIYQAKHITDGQISALFYMQLVIFSLIACLGYFSAPHIGSFFGEPAVSFMVQVIVWVLIIEGLLFPQIMMIRDLEFDRLVKRQLASQVIGSAIGIGAAVYGYGIWSLVIRIYAEKLVMMICVWSGANWFPATPSFHTSGKLCLFGLNLLGSRVLTFVSQNSAHVILGRVVGLATMGSFNIAYNLAIIPANKIQGGLITVLIPAAAKVSEEESSRGYYSGLFILSFFFAPIMFGIGSVAVPMIAVVYGPGYEPVAAMLPFLAFAGYFRGMSSLIRGFMISGGSSSVLLVISLIESVLSVPLLLLACSFTGMSGVLIVYILMASLTFFLFVIARNQQSPSPESAVGKCMKSVIISAGMGAVVYLVANVMSNALAALVCGVVVGIVFYTTIWLVTLRSDEYRLLRSVPLLAACLAPIARFRGIDA